MVRRVSIGGDKMGANKICEKKTTSGAGDQQGPPSGRAARRGAAVWLFTKVASFAGAVLDGCGHAASLAMARIARGNGGGGRQRRMKLVEALALGNRRQLLLIVCDDQSYLVGAGADNVGSILAIEPGRVSRDRLIKGSDLFGPESRGPELVRPELARPGARLRTREARPPAASEAGPDLWH